jgi:ADP-heptose:LPS heptosyltransferase
MPESSDPIVIFRIGSMGDTVVALPCFHAVRRAFPASSITLLTNIPISSKAAPMLGVLGSHGGFVDHVFSYPIGLRNPIQACRLLLRLWLLNARTMFYMRSNPTRAMIRRDRIFFRLAGFRHIHCIPRSQDQLVSRFDIHTKYLEPEASRLARCCASLGNIDLADPSNWDLLLTNPERALGAELAAKVMSPFLVINTGGKDASKDWGYERWAQLLPRLRQSTALRGLAIVGSPDDDQRAEELSDAWGDGAVNFCGGPSPRVVAALLAHARLFIGHDSGPLHLAQCMGIPALGIFGSFNTPKQWHPMGSHVQVIHEQRGVCFISVDQVLTKALAMLHES